MNTDHDMLELLTEFLSDYYREDVTKAVKNNAEAIWIDYKDLWRFDPDIAEDCRTKPEAFAEHLEEAFRMVDLPLPNDDFQATARIYNLNDEHIYPPGAIRKEHGGKYVGITGILERVTSTSDLPNVLAFDCQNCPNAVRVPQIPTQNEPQEPNQCPQCEHNRFRIDDTASEWSDYAKVRIQSRPSSDTEGKITGYVLNDLIDEGGENGLIDRAGEPVTVYGVVERVQKQGRGENKLLFDHFLNVKAVEFERDEDTVEIEKHRDEFTELANSPDAVDKFAESIAPNLHATDAWETAFEFAVAYLFGAPRIDLPNGPTYRGDLHFLIISDYGMGKSDFSSDIEAYSPKCISKSTTALSSDVGLTAAAVKDDFGEGQWTIKPGLLVRANGGHLILDEIDKGPDELTDMNDALEGNQVVDVEKAGKSATYESKTGLLALGNPVDGRFNPNEPIPDQLGISESLLSRFDGIVTMEDDADVEQDKNVANAYGRAYTEAQQAQYGESDELDYLDRPVDIEVGQAWIKHARENVQPLLKYEQFEELLDWYANDVRQLNKDFATTGDGENMPVPATVRVLGAAVKMSIAFARARLQDEVQEQQIERAKKLGKRLVKQNWNGEQFDATKHTSKTEPDTQKERMDHVIDLMRKLERENGDGPGTPYEKVTERARIEQREVDKAIENLMQKGEIYEPKTDHYATT